MIALVQGWFVQDPLKFLVVLAVLLAGLLWLLMTNGKSGREKERIVVPTGWTVNQYKEAWPEMLALIGEKDTQEGFEAYANEWEGDPPDWNYDGKP